MAVLVIHAILRHLVDEEKRETLDTTAEERTLFAEVRPDGLPYLNAGLVVGGDVADRFLQHQTFTIAELHQAATWLAAIHHDVGDPVAKVLRHIS